MTWWCCTSNCRTLSISSGSLMLEGVHLAVHTLLFFDTLSSDWPLTYQQCQSKRMIGSADTAIARGRCEILADLARRVMPRGDSSFSLAGYGEYQNNAPTDSEWHAGVPVTVRQVHKLLSSTDAVLRMASKIACTLWQCWERRSTAYSVYCWLAKPYCLSQDIRKEDSWLKKLVHTLSSAPPQIYGTMYTLPCAYIGRSCGSVWEGTVFLVMLQAFYLENSVEVKIGDKRSDHFPVSTGLRQGCVLSPLLFSLYINGLVVELKRRRCGVVWWSAHSWIAVCWWHFLVWWGCWGIGTEPYWYWKNGVQDGGWKLMRRNLPSFISGRNRVCNGTMSFPSGGGNPYGYKVQVLGVRHWWVFRSECNGGWSSWGRQKGSGFPTPGGTVSCWSAVWQYFQEVVRLHGAICPPLWSRSLGLS